MLFSIQAFFSVVISETPTGAILDYFTGYTRVELAILFSAIMVGILALKLVLFATYYWQMSRFTIAIRESLASRLFKAYQFAPHLFHLEKNNAELQRNIIGDSMVVPNGVVVPYMELVLSATIATVVMGFVLAKLPFGLVAVMIGLFVTLMLGISSVQRLLKRLGTQNRSFSVDVIRTVREGMSAQAEARILGRRDWFYDRMISSLQDFGETFRRQQLIQRTLPIGIETASTSIMLIMITVIVAVSESSEAGLATATVVAVAMLRLKQSVNKLSSSLSTISANSASVLPLSQELRRFAGMVYADGRPAPHEHPFETLEMQDVTFAFPTQEGRALNGVSLTVERGQHVAIVGKTGAGKSTILSVLLGLLEPNGGAIRVNGQPMSENTGLWWATIGYVPQSLYWLDESIAANVAFGVPADKRDVQRIRDVIEIAQIADFVDSLPHGINTPIAEDGVTLSGGQRQRLGLARALYHNPQVLILDEATSALDRSTQEALMAALAQHMPEVTVINVTHNVELLRFADCVHLLEAGQVVASGAPDALSRESEKFRTLTRLERAE